MMEGETATATLATLYSQPVRDGENERCHPCSISAATAETQILSADRAVWSGGRRDVGNFLTAMIVLVGAG